MGGGLSRFCVEKIFSHSAEKLRRGTFYCLTNFRYRKILGIKERGEHQDFPPKKFCLIVANISQGYPLVQCFRNFPVAKKFTEKRGEYQDFPSNNISLTVPKNFVGQTS